jgi:hypothetical protein
LKENVARDLGKALAPGESFSSGTYPKRETVARSFIRRRGKALIGHSPVRTQLTWCEKERVPRAIITHCGSEIVTGDEQEIAAKLRAIAAERGAEVRIAYDGMKVTL